MLVEMGERYGKPMMLSETGAEGTGKPSWLHYVCNEVREAMSRGVDVRGICWYPITAYPGWDNSRHAETGLFSSIVADGTRHVDERLLAEFEAQREQFEAMFGNREAAQSHQVTGAACGSCDGVPTHGQPSCHSMGSMRRIRRLLISSSWVWRGRSTSIA